MPTLGTLAWNSVLVVVIVGLCILGAYILARVIGLGVMRSITDSQRRCQDKEKDRGI